MEFFEQLDLCFVMLEAQISEQELDKFLSQPFSEITAERWKSILFSHEYMLARSSTLHRLFRRAGIFDPEEMALYVLRTFYLCHRTR